MKYFVLLLFFFLISCSEVRKNCEISPDYDRLASELENLSKSDKGMDEVRYQELMALKSRCNF